MPGRVSLYLDAARLLAAVAVFVSHSKFYTGGLLWQAELVNQHAVLIFFVLSGFVIAYVTASTERDAASYAVNRLARLYSVVLPALVLTYTLAAIGVAEAPSVYEMAASVGAAHHARDALASLLFLNELWGQHIDPPANNPYWSLGFEAPYYVMFGLVVFVPGWKGPLLASLCALAVGPAVIVIFPLWLLGSFCHRFCRQRQIGRGTARCLLLAAVVLVGCQIIYQTAHGKIADIRDFPSLDRKRLIDYAQYYLIGGAFALSIVGVWFAGPLVAVPAVVARSIRWLAGATLSLYLFHLPLMRFMAAMAKFPAGSVPGRALILVGVPIIVLLLAEVTERRKNAWRRWIWARLNGLTAKRIGG